MSSRPAAARNGGLHQQTKWEKLQTGERVCTLPQLRRWYGGWRWPRHSAKTCQLVRGFHVSLKRHGARVDIRACTELKDIQWQRTRFASGTTRMRRLLPAFMPKPFLIALLVRSTEHPLDVLMVEFTVAGVSCIGLNGGPTFKHSEAFSFQIATEDQAETDRYWNAIVGNGGQESACGWCKDKWGVSWQITPRVLMEAMAAGGEEAKRAFEAMMGMRRIDVAAIEAARRG
jgi:predicted 3-demethylubiquinone-9 3-methyltransferase (glyoxalase superfamily)